MSLAVDHVMEMLQHAELDPEHWEELSRRVKAKSADLNGTGPFIYGDRVIWTDPDGGNEITGTVRSDLDHDGQFWVHFDGTDPNVQTEVYAHELRYI